MDTTLMLRDGEFVLVWTAAAALIRVVIRTIPARVTCLTRPSLSGIVERQCTVARGNYEPDGKSVLVLFQLGGFGDDPTNSGEKWG
jgi:hypothetical protein